MKSALLALLLFWQAAAPALRDRSRFSNTPATSARLRSMPERDRRALWSMRRSFLMRPRRSKTCGSIRGRARLPYALTLSEPVQAEGDTARVLNLGVRNLDARGQSIVFDLQMPDRPYTDINLDLAGQDYLATATVTGLAGPQSPNATRTGRVHALRPYLAAPLAEHNAASAGVQLSLSACRSDGVGGARHSQLRFIAGDG